LVDTFIHKNLADKRKQIQAYIDSLERDLGQARRDLSIIIATECGYCRGHNCSRSLPHNKVGGTGLCRTALAHALGNDVKLAVARGTLDVLEKTYGGDLAGY
jgi:hypothetical protein